MYQYFLRFGKTEMETSQKSWYAIAAIMLICDIPLTNVKKLTIAKPSIIEPICNVEAKLTAAFAFIVASNVETNAKILPV